MTTIQMPNAEEMRARFADLSDQVDAIEKQSEPLRTKRDKLVNDARDKERSLNEEIAAIEAPLYDLKNERGAIVGALRGKTGTSEETAAETVRAETA